MNRPAFQNRRISGAACGLLLLFPLFAARLSPAQSVPAAPATRPGAEPVENPAAAPSTAPTPPGGDRPLLRELDRETRELYRQLQGGVLRVQIPEPQWARNPVVRNNWLTDKYPQLTPEVRQQLLEPQAANSAGPPPGPTAATQQAAPDAPAPAGAGRGYDAGPQARPPGGNSAANGNNDRQGVQGVTIIVPPPNGSQAPQQPPPPDRQAYAPQPPVRAQAQPPAAAAFSPNNLGLLLDGQGHVLVPQFVDRDALGDQPIRLTLPSGALVDARLVGSDQQTGLTVLQLVRPTTRPAGATAAVPGEVGAPPPGEASAVEKPIVLARSRPEEGSLVLLLSPGDGTGRLGVWNGGGRDYGVIVNIDGRVAGITRLGQFLGGPACQLIADQIIRNGAVRRATLGVIITQIEKDDPTRRDRPLLGDRPAVRVDQVMRGSVAERGGLRAGDVLLALEGEPANDIPAVAAAIAARNGPTRLRVLRGDKVIELTVDLQQK